MKIIRPMDLTGTGVVESNATPDEYQIWEPEGRTNSFQSARVSVGGNRGFSLPASSGSKTVSVYDLSTGELIFSFSDGATDDITLISASPDGNFLAYACLSNDGNYDYMLRVYDTTSSQVVFSRTFQTGIVETIISWAPDSSSLFYVDESFFQGFLGCVKVDSATWTASVFSGNLIDEAGFVQENQIFANNKVAGIGASGEYFISFRASAYAGTEEATIICRLSPSLLLTHSQTLSPTIYPQGLLVNDIRSETAIIHGGTGASFFSYADLTPIGTPATISGTAYKGLSVSLDGTEFTLQASSVQPYNRTFSLTDYSELTAKPAVGDYADIYYATDYFLGVSNDGSYDIVDLATNALITQTNPTVTAGDIYTYADHNYEALTDNNDRPDLGAVANPATWLDLGFINPLRMFDNKLDSKTTAPSPLVIDITPGMLVNGLALFNVDAATVQITYTDPTDGLVYDTGQISMLDNSGVQDWYGFFFDPYLVKADLARVDLPAYIDGTVQITLDGAGADVAIGEVVLGTIYKIGDAQYGSSAGIIDFSRKEQDQFGNFEIVPRRFSKRAEFDAVIPPAYGGSVQRTLARLRATPVVWIGSVDLEETIVYGYFREFDILLSNPAFSNVTITVEGL